MSEIVTEEFTISLKYLMKIDTSTGEVLETKCLSRKVDKSNFEVKNVKRKKVEEPTEPKLILENNKFQLTQSAVDLLQASADDKIDIKYEKQGNKIVPVIGLDETFGTKGGCRLTKSNTVSCRGSRNEELSKHGTEFYLVQHPNKEGLFILKTDLEEVEDTEEVVITDDLQQLIDDTDAEITEVSSSIFQL